MVRYVVPHAGTWIEIRLTRYILRWLVSFPTRERGLKSRGALGNTWYGTVVPHAGTWIEINGRTVTNSAPLCRSPRGNVD